MTQMSIGEYLQWVKTNQGHDYESTENNNRFNTNIRTIQGTIADSAIVREIEGKLSEWAHEYEEETDSLLFMHRPVLRFETKTYQATIDKIFRVNCLWNKEFPDNPPQSGWITPENVFSSINDLVRTYWVCKFIDGPKFITEKLAAYCQCKGIKHNSYSQERDEGYYAYHFYIYFDVQVLDAGWNEVNTVAIAEIQVTTQMQEVLKELTHQYFEVTRLEPKSSDNKWKWEVNSNRFRSAYMCHTLHLLEAIILDLRKKALESNRKLKGDDDET